MRGRSFLSTPSARRATQQPLNTGNTAFISIHALREEGDDGGVVPIVPDAVQFLSTPSVRRATPPAHWAGGLLLFLSTPSVRRATGISTSNGQSTIYFYPRPP